VLALVFFGLIALTSYILMEGGFGPAGKLIGAILFLASVIPWIWFSWSICTRRMRDTGVNAWWTLALLVPPLNVAAAAFLILVPSDEFKGRGL
jgi:uncharacterized membrane protein YhaH (DUF805 family)